MTDTGRTVFGVPGGSGLAVPNFADISLSTTASDPAVDDAFGDTSVNFTNDVGIKCISSGTPKVAVRGIPH